jgi:hypothetical protein
MMKTLCALLSVCAALPAAAQEIKIVVTETATAPAALTVQQHHKACTAKVDKAHRECVRKAPPYYGANRLVITEHTKRCDTVKKSAGTQCDEVLESATAETAEKDKQP